MEGAAQNSVPYGALAETLINDKEGGGAKHVFSACQRCCFSFEISFVIFCALQLENVRKSPTWEVAPGHGFSVGAGWGVVLFTATQKAQPNSAAGLIMVAPQDCFSSSKFADMCQSPRSVQRWSSLRYAGLQRLKRHSGSHVRSQ